MSPRWAKQMISLLLVDNFHPVMSYRRVRGKKKATNYRIRFRSLVMVRNQLPAYGVNFKSRTMVISIISSDSLILFRRMNILWTFTSVLQLFLPIYV